MISKGAFYHYFDSKQALLEGLIERMQLEGERLFSAILHDTQLPTLAKLQRSFDTLGRWKTERKSFLIALIRVWYADDNAVVRLHVQSRMTRTVAPMLTEIIREGVQEGALTTEYPDEAGAIVVGLLLSIGERFVELLFSAQPRQDAVARAVRVVDAYNDALERVLGAPAGSLHLLDEPTLREWFDTAGGATPEANTREA
jgi:AcrR family transcriptional regulator